MYYASAAIRDNEELVPSSPENALLPPRSSASIPTLQRDPSEALSVPDPSRSQPKAKVLWSSGLFDCFSDVRNCCITCWCPCITFGQIAETIDKGIPTCGMNGALYALIACGNGCCCLYSCFYRSKLKQQLSIKETPCCEYVIAYRSESGQSYTIKETPCWDCLVHCFCEYCALCQEYRELHTRGLLMSTGNKIKEFNGRLMAPVMEEVMQRDE